MRGEKSAEQSTRTYYYYCCEGKYEDDNNGGRRHICHGHIFTLESRISHCPACGEPLKMLKSNTEQPKAITIALEKCLSCKDRQRSVAINDEHCLGGERYKGGKLQNATGSELCNGCPCMVCCREIIEDANAVKKYGISAIVKAQAKLRDASRQVLRSGNMDEAGQKLFAGIRTQDAVLNDIRYETYERWAIDAFHAIEKELAKEASEKRMMP